MAKIKLQTVLTTFLLRLLLVFAILGAIYLLFFNNKGTSQNANLTSSQKIANIQSLLDQTYITSSQIASFHESTVAGTYNLANIVSQFNSDLSSLQSALSSAPKQLSSSLKSKINTVIAEEQNVKDNYQTANSVLGQTISYDPSADLPLPVSSNKSTLEADLQASVNGLSSVAGNQSSVSSSSNLSVQSDNGGLIVNPETKKQIQIQVSCFKTSLTAIQSENSSADTDINNCINSYAKLRLAAIEDLQSVSFNRNYVSSLKNNVVPLLSDLAKLITTPKPNKS